MSKERITHLNYHRYQLKNNIDKLKDRISLTRNRLHEDLEKLNTFENNYELINRQIVKIIKPNQFPKIEVIKYMDERDKEKVMLKIDIDNSGKSIYKSISNVELMLCELNDDPTNNMNFLHRVEEIAFQYLEKHGNINSLFNDLTKEVNEIILEFEQHGKE
jgi:hypothetical protein